MNLFDVYETHPMSDLKLKVVITRILLLQLFEVVNLKNLKPSFGMVVSRRLTLSISNFCSKIHSRSTRKSQDIYYFVVTVSWKVVSTSTCLDMSCTL